VKMMKLKSKIEAEIEAGRGGDLGSAPGGDIQLNESASESGGELGSESDGEPGENGTANEARPRKRGVLRKIVVAPVRLFVGIFRRGNRDSLAIRQAKSGEVDRMKLLPVQRTRGSEELMADTGQPVDSEATVAHRAAQNLFDDAVSQFDKGRVEPAIEKLNAAIVLAPDFAEAYNMLGVCYDQKQQYAAARQEYEKALRIDRANARYMNNLGYSCYLAGDDGQAIKWYRRGLKETPQDKRLHNNLGMAYGRKGNMSKAREHFIIAVGETGAHLNLGYLFNQRGEYEESIRQYQLALNAHPESLPALGSLAQLYERTGRLREAAQVSEQYRRVVAISQQRDHSVEQE
ncbi:MAG: tetratricopeptide repeat protein, partial [Acidobacteria bacterium]|nr:tetratricopeptide repeat protein [Acidobacteriota bacterium]